MDHWDLVSSCHVFSIAKCRNVRNNLIKIKLVTYDGNPLVESADEPYLRHSHALLAAAAAAEEVVARAEETPAAPRLLLVLHWDVDLAEVREVGRMPVLGLPKPPALISLHDCHLGLHRTRLVLAHSCRERRRHLQDEA